MSQFRKFIARSDAQDLIEYALLIGLITAAVIVSIRGTGTTVSTMYADAVTVLNGTGEAPAEGAPGPGGNPGRGGNPGNGNPGNDKPGGNGTPNPGGRGAGNGP